ncbi:MAG: hypothetical protein U0174_18835 [Polyangiaceae bacterium]
MNDATSHTEADDAKPEDDELLGYHRFDSPGIAPALLRAGACIGLGGPVILLGSLSLFLGVPPWGKVLALAVGGVSVAFGLFTGFVTIPRLLSVDSGLSVFRKGVLIEVGHTREFYAWSSIARVICENDHVVLQLKDAPPRVVTESFARKKPSEIAPAIERTRMRVALSML